ncbi:glycosyltransferase family 39 protein [Synechococcus sp. CS-1324]|nr:glycosyltransferase family 39 protein [Synechococcus sp. CS-1324]PZV03298.1 MAG: 4-amino-4-deoxy-L-arabinose transferase [Cyanobium sp.]
MAKGVVTEGTTAQGADRCSALRRAVRVSGPRPRPLAGLRFRSLRLPAATTWCWWLALGLIWLACTAADRLWLQLDQRLPAWDQAEYLNSAVDHGRALGLLPGGGWGGWGALLDLSPKIPPLASLVNGTVMGMAGDSPDQASWALSLWQALLLTVVACWGRQLVGPGFGLLSAALVGLTPALAALRVDFTLDLPLTAAATLALWLLGRWCAPAPSGGRWGQSLAAAAAIAAAVLVKQSALLVLALPCLWAIGTGLRQRPRRLQVLAALALVLAAVLPWLHHNWITTLGGTNRAVIESGTREGDPGPFSLASLLWYTRLGPEQLGMPLLAIGGLGGLLAWLRRLRRRSGPSGGLIGWGSGWGWLLGCALAGWLCTSLSPNKDPRYIAPVLPLLVLLLARGWWSLLHGIQANGIQTRWRGAAAAALLGIGLAGTAATTAVARIEQIEAQPGSPLVSVIAALRQQVANQPVTVVVIPTTASLNQHNVSSFGRLNGGQILGREIGKRKEEHPLVLEQAEWLLLASGDQGTERKASRRLSREVRRDGRFRRVGSWPWDRGREIELWRRRADAPPAGRFDQRFIALARGIKQGPAGLGAVFAAIGPQHQLDGHFLYQRRVNAWAWARLERNPSDPDALWSLGLLAVLRNRPSEADGWFSRLERLAPTNPWPSAYRAVVLLADWQAGQAAAVAQGASGRFEQPVLKALADLAGVLSGDLRRIQPARQSLPRAIRMVQAELEGEPESETESPQ